MTKGIITTAEFALPVGGSLGVKKCRRQNGEGKRISIITGTHGDELEGQYVCCEVARRIDAEPEKLCGTVDIYPALNPMGIDTITRGIPGFDLDMNRTFPGSENGAVTEQVAAKIIADLKGSDMAVDIHASNIFLREIPQVRINEETADDLVPYAKLLNVDFIWVHAAATVLKSTLAHSLNSIGAKTLVVEMGVGMRITKTYGDRLTDGIFNLMKELGIWQGEPDKTFNGICARGDSVAYVNAPAAGLFIPEKSHGDHVRRGEVIGGVYDPLQGKKITTLHAPDSGLLFTLREYPIVDEGSLIARILEEDL